VYLANSRHIKDDIKKYYGRDAEVVHPPVDTERFDVPEPKKRQGFVMASRQVPHKRFDLAILACNQLGLPLTVLGKGPEHERLRAIAGPTITFIKEVSDDEMPHLIAKAKAFIFPSFEDFGVIPVEAMATGTPVIAYRAGGALDYVEEGKTGLFIEEQTVDALVRVLQDFDAHTFDAHVIKAAARVFSRQNFEQHMRAVIEQEIAAFEKRTTTG
jgi:glycosyltransferase involved in cell wall biosynthesis